MKVEIIENNEAHTNSDTNISKSVDKHRETYLGKVIFK